MTVIRLANREHRMRSGLRLYQVNHQGAPFVTFLKSESTGAHLLGADLDFYISSLVII